jgi:hypothetical protein
VPYASTAVSQATPIFWKQQTKENGLTLSASLCPARTQYAPYASVPQSGLHFSLQQFSLSSVQAVHDAARHKEECYAGNGAPCGRTSLAGAGARDTMPAIPGGRSLYNTGVTSRLRKSDDSSPPMITIANGL